MIYTLLKPKTRDEKSLFIVILLIAIKIIIT
jgi:hypothetical protein